MNDNWMNDMFRGMRWYGMADVRRVQVEDSDVAARIIIGDPVEDMSRPWVVVSQGAESND